MSKPLRLAATLIFAAVLLASSVCLLWACVTYNRTSRTYAEIGKTYTAPTSSEMPYASTAPDAEETGYICPITVDFPALQESNTDVVGWLYGPGTAINYPVLKGESNSKWLRTAPNGESSIAGSIFLDYRCGETPGNAFRIIYGHNMSDGSMFGSLCRYREQAYYDEHPVMWLLSPDAEEALILIAGFTTDSQRNIAYHPVEASCAVEVILSEALSESDFACSEEALLLARGAREAVVLSTCSYAFPGARYVIVAVPVNARQPYQLQTS